MILFNKNTTSIPFLFVIAAAALGAYSNIFHFAFLYDDGLLISLNEFITSFSYLKEIFTSTTTAGAGFSDSFYRPTQILSYLFVHSLVGLNPVGFHTLNLSLHILNGILLFLLARGLGLRSISAGLATLVWILHPMHIEAVTYMSATADPMHTLFMLLALYILLPDFSVKRVSASFAFFILALISKEPAVVFPGVLMLFIFLVSDNRKNLKSYAITLPFWALSIVYFALHSYYLKPAESFSIYKDADIHASSIVYRMETFLGTLPQYLQLIFWPKTLGFDRPVPVRTEFFTGPVLLGTALALLPFVFLIREWKKNQKPWISWAGLTFFIAFFPMAGVIRPVNSLFLEHWMYFASMPLFITLAFLISRFLDNKSLLAKRSVTALILLISLVLGTLTYRQNFKWKDAITFFSSILEYNPGIQRVRHNLAVAYFENGENDKALEQYQEVLKNTQLYPQTYYNMALVYIRKGSAEEAEKYLLKTIEKDPRFFRAYKDLTRIYLRQEKFKLAEEYKQKYLQLRPQDKGIEFTPMVLGDPSDL